MSGGVSDDLERRITLPRCASCRFWQVLGWQRGKCYQFHINTRGDDGEECEQWQPRVIMVERT